MSPKKSASSLHPFSRRVALLAGGAAVLGALAALIWARTRPVAAPELARVVSARFVPLDGTEPLANGAAVPVEKPLAVYARNRAGRPVRAVALAIDEAGAVIWFAPAGPEEAPVVLPTSAERRLVPGAVRELDVGPKRLVTLVGLEEDLAGAWLARWRAGQTPPVAREVRVFIGEE